MYMSAEADPDPD